MRAQMNGTKGSPRGQAGKNNIYPSDLMRTG